MKINDWLPIVAIMGLGYLVLRQVGDMGKGITAAVKGVADSIPKIPEVKIPQVTGIPPLDLWNMWNSTVRLPEIKLPEIKVVMPSFPEVKQSPPVTGIPPLDLIGGIREIIKLPELKPTIPGVKIPSLAPPIQPAPGNLDFPPFNIGNALTMPISPKLPEVKLTMADAPLSAWRGILPERDSGIIGGVYRSADPKLPLGKEWITQNGGTRQWNIWDWGKPLPEGWQWGKL